MSLSFSSHDWAKLLEMAALPAHLQACNLTPQGRGMGVGSFCMKSVISGGGGETCIHVTLYFQPFVGGKNYSST